jgi:hypothetical protein
MDHITFLADRVGLIHHPPHLTPADTEGKWVNEGKWGHSSFSELGLSQLPRSAGKRGMSPFNYAKQGMSIQVQGTRDGSDGGVHWH